MSFSNRLAKTIGFTYSAIFCNQFLRIPFLYFFYRHGGVSHDDPAPAPPRTASTSVKQLTVGAAAVHPPFSIARSPLRVENGKERGCSLWWTEDAVMEHNVYHQPKVKLTPSPPSLAVPLWRPGYGDVDDSWPSGAAVRNRAKDNFDHRTRPSAHEAACCRHTMRCRNATCEPPDAQLVDDIRGATAGGATTTDGATGANKETRSVQTQTSLRKENRRNLKHLAIYKE
jgi:hypothetical protein